MPEFAFPRFRKIARKAAALALGAALMAPVAKAECNDYNLIHKVFEENTLNYHYACVAHERGFGCLLYEPLNPDIGQQYLINVDRAGNKINRIPIGPPDTPIGAGFPTAPFAANGSGYAFVYRDDAFTWYFAAIDYDGNFLVGPKQIPISSNPALAYNPAGFYGLFTTEPDESRPECKVTYLTVLDTSGDVVNKVQISSAAHIRDCTLEHQRDRLTIIPSQEGFVMMHKLRWTSVAGGGSDLYANRRGMDGAAPQGEIHLESSTNISLNTLGINSTTDNEYGFTYIMSASLGNSDVIHARVIVDPVDPRFWWLEEKLMPYVSGVTSKEIISEGKSAFDDNDIGVVFRGYDSDTLLWTLYFLSFTHQGALTQMPVIVTPNDAESLPRYHSIMPVEGGFAISYDKDWRPGPRAEYDNYITIIGGCPQVSPPGSEHPVKIERNDGNIDITWEEGDADERYNIYEGTLPLLTMDFVYDHMPLACHATGMPAQPGELAEAIATSPGSHYYLVTSSNAGGESSFGYDSDGNERNPLLKSCGRWP